MVDFTVLIVTHNRAALLRDTLHALRRQDLAGTWEVIVVDNNSTDDTRQVTTDMAGDYPVALRYLFEGRPGKYWGVNAGIAAANGRCIATTDDDAFPEADWLTRAAEGFAEYGSDFVGGPVYPLFRESAPEWIDWRSAIVGKVLGLQDHGVEPREYGCGGVSWPLGVNVAYRREAFPRAGPFDGRLGRTAGTLRNQSQREWHLRARTAGLRGMYVPGMAVRHVVESARLTRRYFYRWFYWHGISRAILNRISGADLLEPEGAPAAAEHRILGVPVSLWRDAARAAVSAARRQVRGDRRGAFEYELRLCFWAGVLREGVRRRTRLAVPSLSPGAAPESTHCDATCRSADLSRRSA